MERLCVKATLFSSTEYTNLVKGSPAGGGYSTVEDLLNFSKALLSHKLLGPEWTEALFEGKVDVDSTSRFTKYAYGFCDKRENSHLSWTAQRQYTPDRDRYPGWSTPPERRRHDQPNDDPLLSCQKTHRRTLYPWTLRQNQLSLRAMSLSIQGSTAYDPTVPC